ncbi:Na+/H+ antiporter NhaC family protein [Virgibacillus halophilus]|uniref:Na+/H+ antiporter NhaC family protein n=1 Tax=Tigheibacillus halophilus TaxID=361280 RepID=A0ABU5C425_9BACI|nr:Na+/H+ antiporter NhaC family protein [Virgibacillus halophilus]
MLFFGDKLSPLSDTTNIAPAMAETDLFSHVKHMLWDTIPAFVISLILYWLVSKTSSANGGSDANVIEAMKTGLDHVFVIHPLLLLMPVFTIILMIKRAPAIPALMGVSMLGGLLAILVQGTSVTSVIHVMTDGFHVASGVKEVDALLNRGGIDVHAWDSRFANAGDGAWRYFRGDGVL